MIQDKERNSTDNFKNKRTMPLSWAIILILLVAFAGGLAYYFQFENFRKLTASSQQAIADQQYQTLVAFDQIEKNLARIREHESMIQQDFSTPDMSGVLSPEDRIQNEIDFIQHLLNENNLLMASLEEKLDQKDARLSEYDKTVRILKVRVNEYQSQLDNLLAEKNSLELDLNRTAGERDELVGQVNQLGQHVDQQDSVITAQKKYLKEKEDEMHSAYYAIGTYKDLRDRDILKKEGGFLGINGVKILEDDLTDAQFHRIDTREVNHLPIFSKRFEIINDRIPSSYEVEYSDNLAEWLNIKDPDKFWGKSRYLVIVVRDDDNRDLAQSW